MFFLSIKLLLKHGPFQPVKSRGQEIYIREEKKKISFLKTEAWMAMYQNTADWLCVLQFFCSLSKDQEVCQTDGRPHFPYSSLCLIA